MKRLSISILILALLLALSLSGGQYVKTLCDRYTSQLTQAQQLAQQNQWTQARELTTQVLEDWNAHSFLLHTLLRHSDTDQILISLGCVEEYLRLEEMDQYAAANTQLITQLGLLAEAEQPTLENVL